MKKYTRLSKPQTMALALGVLASSGTFGVNGILDYNTLSGEINTAIVEQGDYMDFSSSNDDFVHILSNDRRIK